MRGDVLAAAALLLLAASACFDGSDGSGARLTPIGGGAPAPSGETSGGEPPGAVGVYRGPGVSLLLDAEGGYEWTRATGVARGRWRLVAADVVELVPADGSIATRLALRADSVVDPAGVELLAARAAP